MGAHLALNDTKNHNEQLKATDTIRCLDSFMPSLTVLLFHSHIRRGVCGLAQTLRKLNNHPIISPAILNF